MSTEERESIINEAVERALLKLPDVVNNLLLNHSEYFRKNKEFYEKYQEFKDYKEFVVAAVEEVDRMDTTLPYTEKLEKAVPRIREMISSTKGLNTTVNTPSRFVPQPSGKSNGEI